MDGAHLSAWLHCLTTSEDLENDLDAAGKGNLSELLDFPPSYGGGRGGLQSLVVAADEEYMGSFVGIAAALISLCRNTELPVYIRIAEALEETEDMDAATGCATIKGMKEAYKRMGWLRYPLSEDESKTATELVKGSRPVEMPGAYDPERPDPALEPITLPEPRLLSDYTTAPCKHDCGIYKQIRHAKQAHILLTTLDPTKQALLRATAGQCGLDAAHCHTSTVKNVVSLYRPGGMDGGSREAALFCAATLHRFGLPVDYARLKTHTLPESCACCNAPL